MARLSIRIDLGPGHRIGPGKVRLLETIAAHLVGVRVVVPDLPGFGISDPLPVRR